MTRMMFVRTAIAALAVFSAGQTMAAGPYDPAPVIIGKHYEQFREHNCDGGHTCFVRFSKPPSGKTLTIKQVACAITSEGGAHVAFVRLGVRSQLLGTLRVKPLPITLVTAEEGPDYYYSLLADLNYPVKNVVTELELYIPNPTDTTQSRLECQISGALSP